MKSEGRMTTYVLAVLPKPSLLNLVHSSVPVPSTPVAQTSSEVANAGMAPIELHQDASYIPFVAVLGHQGLTLYLSAVALHTIYRSYKALPPSSATRHRQSVRRDHVQTFSLLALLSLGVAVVFGVRSAGLSYRVWATERGIELPTGLFRDKGALRPGYHPGKFQPVSWLSDTPIYRDTIEIIAETARYSWWGQQIDISLIPWSLYLALEGQRRNLSNLWAFLALSQLVNLSYAQNLFFVAVLLTPVPLPSNVRELTRSSVPATLSLYARTLERIFPNKADGFLPAPGFYIALLLLNFTSAFLIPFASNTPSFISVATSSRLLPFSFLILPYVIPESWGKTHDHPHYSHKTYITLFRTISVVSFMLHGGTSAVALFRNTPQSTYYRHSLLHPFKEEHRSALERSTSAVGHVLGAISEHPAVTAVGLDVLLSGLTLGIWAAVRVLDPREMLTASVPFVKPVFKETENVAWEVKEEVEKVAELVPATVRRRVGRPKKYDHATATAEPEETSTISASKRRGRPPKKALPSAEEAEDSTYEPAAEEMQEGDEDVDEDWEAGAFAWGLISAGGLGVGSAAVYGGEVLAR